MVKDEKTPVEFQEWLKNELNAIKEAVQEKKAVSDLMTKKDASEYLSVNLSTIHNWVKGGILKPTYLGGRVYFKREDILSALNEEGQS